MALAHDPAVGRLGERLEAEHATGELLADTLAEILAPLSCRQELAGARPTPGP